MTWDWALGDCDEPGCDEPAVAVDDGDRWLCNAHRGDVPPLKRDGTYLGAMTRDA